MNLAKLHIFLVDDEPGVLKGMARALRPLKCQISCFSDAITCLGELQVSKCDLLITDIIMSGMDGIELLIEVKRMMPELPVLVITGYSNLEVAVRALRNGAVYFIEKPVKREFFLNIVQSTLEKSR